MTALEPADQSRGPTAQLASYVSDLKFIDLDTRANAHAKRHILDGIGAVLAGA